MNRIRPWLTILRLGLVQASIGAVVVFSTSTLNRVMTVEFALPALIPGSLVGFHYAVQMLRPRWGHGSDRGGRRTPWIIGGMALLAAGAVLAAAATAQSGPSNWVWIAFAVAAYGLIGMGVGAAGTSLLLLLARVAGDGRRAAAATLVWMMMIAGFIVTAGVAGHMLAPFSPERLVWTAAVIAGGAFLVSVGALVGLEPRGERMSGPPRPVVATAFGPALREVWSEPEARRFTLFVFLSMLAYSAQELVLEPFAGTVFALPPADSAKLAGLQHTGLLAGMVLVAVLGSLVGGPRLGSMRLWTTFGCLASAIAALALAGVGASADFASLRVAVIALGAANGAFSIAAVAGMMQLASHGRPGREGVRMGLWGAAQALAFACGGLVGTGASDLARHVFGSAALAYAAIFLGEAVLFCFAAGLALRAFPRTAQPSTAQGASASTGVRRWAT